MNLWVREIIVRTWVLSHLFKLINSDSYSLSYSNTNTLEQYGIEKRYVLYREQKDGTWRVAPSPRLHMRRRKGRGKAVTTDELPLHSIHAPT